MKLGSLIENLGSPFRAERGKGAITPPAMSDAVRVPYGPFRFRSRLTRGQEYSVLASTDLRNWAPVGRGIGADELIEYVDSAAFKFTYRFYRLLAGTTPSANMIGYASVTLPPGFSMIANPFHSSQTVSDIFKTWPDGTSLNRFDTRLFRLVENGVKGGKWTNEFEKLVPGEGAIFFNPTTDYKSVSFVGEVLQGHLAIPMPSGFSIRSSVVPQPGNLVDDMHFPIANGDVVHLFDREQQKYVLHPFVDDKWTAGAPVISVGEAFWIAKTEPGNWNRNVTLEGPE